MYIAYDSVRFLLRFFCPSDDTGMLFFALSGVGTDLFPFGAIVARGVDSDAGFGKARDGVPVK